MMKAVWSGIAAAVFVAGVSVSASAQVVPANLNVTVTVNSKAKLTVGPAAITFADADPDVTPVMTSAAVTINVKARTSAAGNVTLTMLAGGDLVSGTDTIAITELTWTAGGANFVPGTANKGAAQPVGSWTGSGNPSGTNTFSLPNSWAYATGSYTATLTYTLTVP